MMFTVLFYIFVVVTVIQIIYYLSFAFFAFGKESNVSSVHKLPISVIICAKNEAKNLNTFLPDILTQEYPDFEVVLINDASSDTTLEVMEKFQEQYTNIKIVNVENNETFWGNKKYALTLGIKAAKNEHLVFTDADCKPVSSQWLTTMTSRFTSEKSIVLGYGKYEAVPYSFVNLMVRYETLLTAVQYFSYAAFGSPYMGVGRNLAYTKSEFFGTKGFINHMNIRSGDDDLFIQDAAHKQNTTTCIHANSFTVSKAPNSLYRWFQQKRRHISTASYYKFKHKILLGFFFISKVFMFTTGIIMLFLNWKISLPILLSYYVVQYIVMGKFAQRLKETTVVYALPFLEIFLVLFQITIFIANSISKPTHWK